eukprot:scaffold95178_cov30-Tisochrysis_lutea.AAC.2
MPEGVRFLPHGMREDEGYGLTLDVHLQETSAKQSADSAIRGWLWALLRDTSRPVAHLLPAGWVGAERLPADVRQPSCGGALAAP